MDDDRLIEDKSDVNRLIEILIPLTVGVAKRIARTYTKPIDEVVAYAQFRLVEKINKGLPEDIETYGDLRVYMYVCLMYDIRNNIFRDKVVKVPKDAKVPVSITHNTEKITTIHHNILDTIEIIEKCIETPFERSVVELRREGLTDEEISQILECTRSPVTKARKRVEERYVAYKVS